MLIEFPFLNNAKVSIIMICLGNKHFYKKVILKALLCQCFELCTLSSAFTIDLLIAINLCLKS